MFKKHNYVFTALLLAFPMLLKAQMPNDGLMMSKHDLCTVLQYSDSRWDHYWQGETFRSNSNLGTVSNQNVMLMSAYGITDRINLLFALPWVRTDASDSYLSGQSGIQDLSLWLKWKALQWRFGKNELSLQTTGGVSSPLTNYPADFLPLSIGFHARTASLRAIAHYYTGFGLYATVQAGHTWRSNVELDRDSYLYHNDQVESNKAITPNVFDATFRLGFLKPKFQAEVWADRMTGLSGDDIRYNDAPGLTNKMQAYSAGIWGKFWFTKKIAVSAGIAQVLDGRNVGKSQTWNAGIFYLFNVGKKIADK